eukprot:8578835-Pyramimonas_sp.AAC.1
MPKLVLVVVGTCGPRCVAAPFSKGLSMPMVNPASRKRRLPWLCSNTGKPSLRSRRKIVRCGRSFCSLFLLLGRHLLRMRLLLFGGKAG